jgi:hypothetical protein
MAGFLPYLYGSKNITKQNGPNPLKYVGVTFSDSGLTATLWEKVNDDWVKYSEIDGSASYQRSAVAPEYRGKGYNLSNFYPEYDWVGDNGYDNFASWVNR